MLVAGMYLREFVADGVAVGAHRRRRPGLQHRRPLGLHRARAAPGVPTRTMFAVLEDIADNG